MGEFFKSCSKVGVKVRDPEEEDDYGCSKNPFEDIFGDIWQYIKEILNEYS